MPLFKVTKKNDNFGTEGYVVLTEKSADELALDVRGYEAVIRGNTFLDLNREEATRIRNYLDNWLEATSE